MNQFTKYLQTVELMLKHRANTNIESKFDKTPLEIASKNGRPDIFEILQVVSYSQFW